MHKDCNSLPYVCVCVCVFFCSMLANTYVHVLHLQLEIGALRDLESSMIMKSKMEMEGVRTILTND